MKNALCLAATITATVVGAGFVTGQEIYAFFNVYGKISFIGLFFVFVLFYFDFYTLLLYCRQKRIDSFSEFLSSLQLCSIANWIEACVALFSFCGFCAMASATGALLSQTLHMNYLYGVASMLVICGIVLLKDIRAIAAVNLILAPVICIGLIYFSICGILFRSVQTFAAPHYFINVAQIILSALVYASYNILSAVVVLCSMRNYCDSARTVKRACVMGAGALAFLAFLVWITLAIYTGKVQLGEIPMLDIAARGGRGRVMLYALFMIASVLTTALGCGYAVLSFLKNRFQTPNTISVFVLIATALPVCMLGFADIVRVLYSFFGYLGLPLLGVLFFIQIKNGRNTEKKSKKYGK